MIRFIQVNLRRMGAARSLLTQAARERETDVLLISEPPRGPPDNDKCRSGVDHGAQIFFTDSARMAVDTSFSGRGFVGVSAGGFLLVSCYLPSSLTNAQYKSWLDDIGIGYSRFPNAELLVTGDFNARVREWGSDRTDLRGELLLEFAAGLDLVCDNVGNAPTFDSVIGTSVIDFTLSRLTGGRRVVGWKIDYDCFTGSDHNSIVFEVQDGTMNPHPAARRRPEGWSVRKLDVGKLISYIGEERAGRRDDWLGADADEAADKFHKYVRVGCDLSMPKRTSPGRRRPAYWWNEEIAEKRRSCIRCRRAFQRAGTRDGGREQKREAWQLLKKELRVAIRSS